MITNFTIWRYALYLEKVDRDKIILQLQSRLSVHSIMEPNEKKLFKYNTPSKRFKSHGCIRLAQPTDLFKYFGEKYAAIPYSKVIQKYNSGEMHHIDLKQEIRVHINYLTAYAGEDGTLLPHQLNTQTFERTRGGKM
ncbi:MAG: hypothetical protein U9Q90_05290 [Campylobacterota bacterium]|nr:hypothetical protein [Campylobacterota bacterium]